MQNETSLHSTRCAICNTEGNATELYPANFSESAFSEAVFSARRLPDGVHYSLVKCKTCGLVRSDPITSLETLAKLYQRSAFTYQDELTDLKYTYGRYLAELESQGVTKGSLLEIGSGNGFFLEIALEQGYASITGVEPSDQAIAAAAPNVQPFMICDIMRRGLITPETIDVICIFQVFDHITDPGTLLDDCYEILKPGGLLLAFNHNVEALSARILGERSPILDIEHTYLYSFKTMTRILEDHKYKMKDIGPAYNRYKLSYLAHLFPLPAALKTRTLAFLKNSAVGNITLSVPLGNLYAIAQKP